ncbi:MAG: DUF3185 family protein [Planctomycetes bacterium]|nr:DUF3185 family protein [Planctomycetota bacterium]
MNRTLSIVVLLVGLVLLVLGFNESESVASDFSRLFTDEPTDRALWLLIGGGALALIGAAGLFRGEK